MNRTCNEKSAEHDETVVCRRELDHDGPHVGLSSDGTVQWTRVRAAQKPSELDQLAHAWSQILPQEGWDVELTWGRRTTSELLRFESALLSENGVEAMLFSDTGVDSHQRLLVFRDEIRSIEWTDDQS